MDNRVALLLIAIAATVPSAEARGQLFGGAELQAAHVDPSFGYSIRPPKGWAVSTQHSGFGSMGETLITMTSPAAEAVPPEIVVRYHTKWRDMQADQFMDEWWKRLLEDYRKDMRQQSGGKLSEPKVSERNTDRIAGRPGAQMSIRFTQGAAPITRRVAVVRARPRGYFVIGYSGGARFDKVGIAAFNAVLGSFRLLEDESSDREIRGAIQQAEKWRKSLSAIRLRDKLQPVTHYRVSQGMREVGWLMVTEQPFTDLGVEGVRVVEQGWTFEGDGERQQTIQNIFLSNDLQSESWQHSVVALLPAKPGEPTQLGYAYEEGARERDVLITAQLYAFGQTMVNNPHIKLPEGYCSKLLLRWFARLVDLSKPATYAFSTFDHQRGALVLRLIEVRGRGLGGGVTVIEREGLSGPATEMSYDASGRLLSMSGGGVRLERADAASSMGRWSKQTQQAGADLQVLQTAYRKSLGRLQSDGR